MRHTEPLVRAAVVALEIRVDVSILARRGRIAREDRVVFDVRIRDRQRVGGRRRADPGGGLPLLSVVDAAAELRLQRPPRIAEAMRVDHRAVLRLALLEIAFRPIELVGVERRHLALCADAVVEPAERVLRDVVDVEIEQRQRHVVVRTDAESIARRDAVLVDLRSFAVGLAVHRIQAEGRSLAGPRVEIDGRAPVAVAADRPDDIGLIDQLRLLRDLVDDAAGGAAAEQHRRRAAQYFDALVVERVALVGRWVA